MDQDGAARMFYEISDQHGSQVTVEASNWLLAFGKGVALIGWRLPDYGQCTCEIAGDVVTMTDGSGQRWKAVCRPNQVDVVAVGPQEILSSLLPDEDDDDIDSDMPPPLLRMPVSILAPPEEPLFSEAEVAENVFDLSQDLVGRSADDACRQALALAIRLVPCEAGTVMKGTLADTGLEVVGGIGNGENLIGQQRPFGAGLAGLAHDLAMPVKLDDGKDRRHLQRYDDDYGTRARAMLCVPVMKDGAVYGVLELLNPIHPFSEVDVDAASTVANTLATALEASMW